MLCCVKPPCALHSRQKVCTARALCKFMSCTSAGMRLHPSRGGSQGIHTAAPALAPSPRSRRLSGGRVHPRRSRPTSTPCRRPPAPRCACRPPRLAAPATMYRFQMLLVQVCWSLPPCRHRQASRCACRPQPLAAPAVCRQIVMSSPRCDRELAAKAPSKGVQRHSRCTSSPAQLLFPRQRNCL